MSTLIDYRLAANHAAWDAERAIRFRRNCQLPRLTLDVPRLYEQANCGAHFGASCQSLHAAHVLVPVSLLLFAGLAAIVIWTTFASSAVLNLLALAYVFGVVLWALCIVPYLEALAAWKAHHEEALSRKLERAHLKSYLKYLLLATPHTDDFPAPQVPEDVIDAVRRLFLSATEAYETFEAMLMPYAPSPPDWSVVDRELAAVVQARDAFVASCDGLDIPAETAASFSVPDPELDDAMITLIVVNDACCAADETVEGLRKARALIESHLA